MPVAGAPEGGARRAQTGTSRAATRATGGRGEAPTPAHGTAQGRYVRDCVDGGGSRLETPFRPPRAIMSSMDIAGAAVAGQSESSRKFGWTPEILPLIGQGTWMIEEAGRDRAVEALRAGIAEGMTLIDTAEMYGNGAAE